MAKVYNVLPKYCKSGNVQVASRCEFSSYVLVGLDGITYLLEKVKTLINNYSNGSMFMPRVKSDSIPHIFKEEENYFRYSIYPGKSSQVGYTRCYEKNGVMKHAEVGSASSGKVADFSLESFKNSLCLKDPTLTGVVLMDKDGICFSRFRDNNIQIDRMESSSKNYHLLLIRNGGFEHLKIKCSLTKDGKIKNLKAYKQTPKKTLRPGKEYLEDTEVSNVDPSVNTIIEKHGFTIHTYDTGNKHSPIPETDNNREEGSYHDF